jgi:hypothetical protein
MHGWLKRPSPALLVAIIAIVFAIGGAAYAGSKVGTHDLENGAVTAAKLHRKAVTTKKIKRDSVTGAKVKESSLGTVPNANAVGGLPANNLVRVASAAVNHNALATSGTAAQTSIDAPRAGFLQIIASGDSFSTVNDAGITCALLLDSQLIIASERTISLSTPANVEENCDTNATTSVSLGSHTVKFNFSGIDNAEVDGATLDVLFVPFGANG